MGWTGDGAVGGSNDFGAQLQQATSGFITFDDLHALTGLPQTALPYSRVKELSDFSIDL